MRHEEEDPNGGQPALGDLIIALWRSARPEIWMVSILPLYTGYLLASRSLVPGLRPWLAFWTRATTRGATTNEFLRTLAAWLVTVRPLLLAMVAMGPLLWLATLLINDVHDLEGDRVNPRKARSPLVQGLLTRGLANQAAYVSAGATLVVAAFVNITFLLLTAGCLVLAWAYSVPPIRLKERAGADVLVNSVGVGLLAGLAGWSLGAPVADVPWRFLPQGLLVAAAIYVPTTLVDLDADRAAGYATLATRLGRRRAYRVGFACWVASNVGALVLAWNGWVIPRRMLPVLVIFTPLLVWEYHRFIGGARDGPGMVSGIILCSLTFLAVNLVFALMYTGLWVG